MPKIPSKTYKQFIIEVEFISKAMKTAKLGLQKYGLGRHTKKPFLAVYPFHENQPQQYFSERLPSGHVIKHYSTKDENIYHVINPRSYKVSTVLVTEPNGSSEKIQRVATSRRTLKNKNRLPVHKLYHHLITKHGKILVTDSQTPGGVRIWQKLSRMKDINVHGWDPVENEPVNTPKYLSAKNQTDTHVDRNKNYGNEQEYELIGFNKLIALHKRYKKNPEYGEQIRTIRYNDYRDAVDDRMNKEGKILRLRLVAHKKD